MHDRTAIAVYLAGALIVLLIAGAATWMVVRDYRVAVEHASLHLDNVTVVLADQARIALENAPSRIRERLSAGAAAARDPGVRGYFEAAFSRIDLAYSGRLMLFRPEGTLLAVYPEPTGGSRDSYSEHPVFELAKQSQSGSIEARGILDPDARVVAFRKLKDQPMLVAVSTPMKEVLERWRRESVVVAVGALVLASLAGMAAFLLARQWGITSRLMAQSAERQMRLDSIIGSAMDAIVTIDESQNIVLFNTAAEKIFRCRSQDAIGSPLTRFIPERFREVHERHVRQFGQSGVTMRRMGGALVLSGVRSDGEEFPIDASISYATVAGKKFFTVILRDVTQRERAREAQRESQRQLEESERRLNSIIGSAMDAIITIDGRHNIVLFNAAAEHIFRCRAEDAIGTPLDRFIPERYRGAHRDHIVRFGESGVTMRRMGAALVLSGVRGDGAEFPIDASISHVAIGGEKFFTVILRDITERQRAADDLKRSHQELRDLYEAMHEVREGERTRIARELHDELAQWLTALKMDASWIASRLPREHEQLVKKAERMKGVVDNTVAAMRRIAADLRPVMLDDLGLVPAIENLLYDVSERTGVVVTLKGDTTDVDLKEPYATAVYRMVQEALTNVARHSGASSVEVRVGVVDSKLRLCVQDNGRGFNPDPARKSFGVLGIRERARTLGGSARIYSPEKGGTVVEIEIPLNATTPEMAR